MKHQFCTSWSEIDLMMVIMAMVKHNYYNYYNHHNLYNCYKLPEDHKMYYLSENG